MKFLPYAPDAIGVVQELTNPNEPDLGQKMMNAGIVGLGEGYATYALRGLDLVPDALEIATALGYEADDPVINRLQKIAPLIQPEHYLRLLSYGGKHAPTEAKLEQAKKDALTPAEDQSIMGRLNRMRTPAVGGLVLPTR